MKTSFIASLLLLSILFVSTFGIETEAVQDKPGRHFYIVVDESESLSQYSQDILNALNGLLSSQKGSNDKDIVSIIGFGSTASVQFQAVPLNQIDNFNSINFIGGSSNVQAGLQQYYDYAQSIGDDGNFHIFFYLSDGFHEIPFEILQKIRQDIPYAVSFLFQSAPGAGINVLNIMSIILNRVDYNVIPYRSQEDFPYFFNNFQFNPW